MAVAPRVVVKDEDTRDRVLQLSSAHQIPIEVVKIEASYQLCLVNNCLAVAETNSGLKTTPFLLDFDDKSFQYLLSKGLKKSDLFVKAIGVKGDGYKVLDATAGWLKDSFMLAALGCEVWACENNIWVYLLVADSVMRADGNNPVRNISLNYCDWKRGLEQVDSVDTIYFDPMYPQEGTKSALPGKEMQLMRALQKYSTGKGVDRNDLDFALKASTKRIVVKRPPNGRFLLDEPDHSFAGKAARYDLYVPRS